MGALIIIAVAVVAIVVAVVLIANRNRSGSEKPAAAAPSQETTRPRPPVAEFHVKGEEAQVFFDVPLPEGEDDVLKSVLVHEAIEVVREKRHSLPIDQATKVVAYGKRDGSFDRVGSVVLETPGTLPPPAVPPAVFKSIGPDPLAAFSEVDTASIPKSAARVSSDKALEPAGADIRLPAAIEAGLRMQGVEPKSASAGDLVLGLLRLSGYTVSESEPGKAVATSATGRTFIHVDRLSDGAYPELDESVVNKFMIEFGSSGQDRGLLISDRFGPYVMYEKEKREPRVRFITRERLQHFVDSLSVR